jgi:hypothetical protein
MYKRGRPRQCAKRFFSQRAREGVSVSHGTRSRPFNVRLQDASTQNNQLSSSLLRLPAEIRIIIYDFAIEDVTVRINTPGYFVWNKWLKPSCSAALVHTCRQIRHEARSIFYAKTTFNISTHGYPNSCALRLLEPAFEAVKLIKLGCFLIMANKLDHGQSESDHPAMRLRTNLASLTNLKHVQVDVRMEVQARSFDTFTNDIKMVTNYLFEGKDVQVHVHAV